MNSSNFQPFYDAIADRSIFPFLAKIVISITLGGLFIVPHYYVSPEWFDKTSILLAMIIGVAMLSLYYATYTFRGILPRMTRLNRGDRHLFMDPVQKLLSTKNLLLSGLLFAFLNCYVAYSFGIPKINLINEPQFLPYAITLYWGYFLAGFVCGMAVLGIFTVSYALSIIGSKINDALDFPSPDKPEAFEYTSPDNCGGTLSIGNALMIFGSVTLIVGILISLYILKIDWEKSGDSAQMLKIIWLVFPYLMSFIVFVMPALNINKALTKYKIQQDDKLQSKLNEIRKKIESGADTNIDNLNKQYQFNQEMREKLHKMRTWPYGFNTNFKYLAVVVTNTFAFYQSAESEIDKIIEISKGLASLSFVA